MIFKKTLGKDPKHLLDYIFGPGHNGIPGRARVLGGTLLGGNAGELANELALLAAGRPDVYRPILHYSISLHPLDRLINDDEALQMASDWADRLGVSNWCLIQHTDQAHQHWHWVGCRVDELGQVSRGGQYLRDYRMAMRFARSWERQLDLTPVATPPIPDRPHGRARVERKSDRADREARNRGQPTLRDRIRARLDAIEACGLRGAALRQALLAAGLDCDVRFDCRGPRGLTWVDLTTQERIKGSELGRRYAARDWLNRNDIGDLQGVGNGKAKCLPHIEYDDSGMDVGSCGGNPAAACTIDAIPRGASHLARNMGRDGCGVEFSGGGGHGGHPGDCSCQEAVVSRLDHACAGNLDRAGCSAGLGICCGNGTGTAVPGGGEGNQPGNLARWTDEGASLGQAGFGGMDDLQGGGGLAGPQLRPAVDMGCLALPTTLGSDGCCNGPLHHSRLPGGSGSGTEVNKGRRP